MVGIKFLKEKILATVSDSFGYPSVGIRTTTNSTERIRVHRLVAETFIPNPENKKEVNHIDNEPKNNAVSNLEWATHYENMAHATKQFRLNHGESNPRAILTEENVLFIRKSILSNKVIAEMFGIAKHYVYYVRSGKTWKYLKD